MWKEIFFTTTFWSFSGGKLPSVVLPHRIILQNPRVFAPKVPSRGHSSELKKSKGTGAERFSASHLLQKSTSALGEAVKGWQRPFQGRWILVFSFHDVDEEGIYVACVRWSINMHWEIFASKVREERLSRTKHRKWIALNSFSRDLLSEHIVYSVVQWCTESPQRREHFCSCTARRSRHSTQRKWTCKWSPEGKNGCLGF